MSSDSPVVTTISARALASRRNGARSRGPRTTAGKARSSRNALKHGLCAQNILVLAREDIAAFCSLETALFEELAPAGALQTVLAQRVVSAAWRLLRADRMEAEVLAEKCYADGGLGLALIRDGNGTGAVATLLRYRGAALAEFMRALKTLQALQAEARADADPAPARRRARYLPTEPNQPEKARGINGLAENRPVDRTQDTPDRNRPNTAPTLPAAAANAKPPRDTTPLHALPHASQAATVRTPARPSPHCSPRRNEPEKPRQIKSLGLEERDRRLHHVEQGPGQSR